MEKMTATRLLNETLRIREGQGAEAAYRFVQEQSVRGGERLNGQGVSEVGNAPDFITESTVPDARKSNLLYALAAASGHTDEALKLLRKAVMDDGFWYPADYLLEDEDLEPLRGMDGFAELADLCAKREEAALGNAAPGLVVLGGENGEAAGVQAGEPGQDGGEAASVQADKRLAAAARPLLLALHGDQENERDSAPFWGTASRAGWTVGLVRSSQMRFSDAYGWDDIDLGAAELREHLETIRGAASNEEEAPVVLGAFSAGAEVALNALLHDELPAEGLVLVSPWLAEPGEWAEALGRLEGRTPRVVLLVGTEDSEGCEAAEALMEAMQEAELEFRLEMLPGMGHDYPADFAPRLEAALVWIAQDTSAYSD
ncbi:hypothetical protein B9G55_23610 [Saccharibacillus sp. O16]|nr:hypothetical protein B9G55_23610 [Saccharibacillus sp. O16]